MELFNNNYYDDETLREWIEDDSLTTSLNERADKIRREIYGDKVYLRGLIEFTNYCKNDCYYCGIRHSNKNIERYRLSKEEILECAEVGYALGYHTFVLQGGDDPFYSDDLMVEIISAIKEKFPDVALTLSMGEKSKESYQKFFNAGADRYLLREESSNPEHYKKLHPLEMELETRQQALRDLREVGFQVGGGFMVDSPFQTTEDIIKDIRFLEEFKPDMIGIGPFLHHKDTPFRDYDNGDLNKTLRLVSILRILFPYALIPSTTALGSLVDGGREMGLKAGANVIMPNLSPKDFRDRYMLYDNKLRTGDEAAEYKKHLAETIKKAGYRIVDDRGDVIIRE